MRVYHFLSEQFGMDDLLKKRLKIATLNDLNDPFELFAVSLSHRWRERAWTQSTGTQLNGQSRLGVGAELPRIGGMPTTFRLPSGAIPISIDAQSRTHQLHLVRRAEGEQIVNAQLAGRRIPFGEAF